VTHCEILQRSQSDHGISYPRVTAGVRRPMNHGSVITLTCTDSNTYVVEPMGWRVHGVISPVEARWRSRPYSLICCSDGIVASPRGLGQFVSAGISAGLGLHPTFSPDTVSEVADQVRGGEVIRYECGQIRDLLFRYRWLKHQIRITTTDGQCSRYWVYARSAINEYRALVKSLFPTQYREEGFGSW